VTASAHFTDVAASTGLTFRHIHGRRRPLTIVETMGSGGAFLDYDQDGWLDIFLVQSGEEFQRPRQESRSRLFRNTGGLGAQPGSRRFEDVTERARIHLDGYGMGCCAGDYDNDGDTDLYVTNYGRSNVLLRNNGDGTFTDVTREAGVGGAKELWSTSCAFADFNGDGWLDLYVCNYVRYDPQLPYCSYGRVRGGCPPNVYAPQRDLLFLNNGGAAAQGRGRSCTFTERAKEAGVDNPRGAGLGVVCADFDGDGRIDLFVANDKTPNALLRNLGGTAAKPWSCRFADISLTAGVGYSESGSVQAGMGTDAGDVDGDGRLDLVVTNFQYEPNSIYHNLGANRFTDVAFAWGLGGPSLLKLGFGVAFLDYDLDGDEDLYVGNGHVFDNVQEFDTGARYEQQDQLFEGGSRFGRHVKRDRFVEVSAAAGPAFAAATVTRGVAVGDFNNNGTPDVLCNDSGGPVRLLKNEPRHRRHWIGLALRGMLSNRSAIGTRVEVRTPDGLQAKEVRSGSSYLSQSDLRLLFGLGSISDAGSVKVEIRWPSGRRQILPLTVVDRYVQVVEPR
jgi:hypothetical protein